MSRAIRPVMLHVLLLVLVSPDLLAAQEAAPSAETAMERLKEGNARFAADKPAAKDLGEKKRKELAKGQRPFAVVLTCADSRVAPELYFDQGLGEIFVVRVAGNVTDPAILGSIEYAVVELKAPLIVVVGHEECGAVKAALAGEKLGGNLDRFVELVHTGKELPKDKKAALAAATKANVLFQVSTLTSKSDILKDLIAAKRVRTAAGVYSLESGKVSWLDATDAKKPNDK